MVIQSIKIQNFKGFSNQVYAFNPRFNVIIGDNGSGKSTVLNALQVALGGYLQCLDLPATKNFRRPIKPSEVRKVWNAAYKSYENAPKETAVEVSGYFETADAPISWKRAMLVNGTTSHNRMDTGALMDLVETWKQGKKSALLPTPIVASFGTERTQAQIRKSQQAQSRRTKLEKAFLAALSDKVDFIGAIEWLHNYEQELVYDREFEGTKTAFFEAIETAIPYLKKVGYNSYYQELEAEVQINEKAFGKTLHSNLSDGLKAMLNLVAELAFRCVALNGFFGKETIKKTAGVVLIDELDMHLHPNWQTRIVQDLKTAFPKIQFIVTTHAPFVIQSLKKEELIFLEPNLYAEEDPFRKSIEEISSEEMGVQNVPRSLRFLEMQEVASQYYNLLEQGHNSANSAAVKSLRKRLNELEQLFSDDPAFVALLKAERNGAEL